MSERDRGRPIIRIAGIVGPTGQAVREARLAADLGYHIGLLSLGALARATDRRLLEHVRAVAEVIPVMGFYLQPAVGGRVLSYAFWRELCRIERVVAIKVAPFDRYATLDVMRAVAASGRAGDLALYTGNDDSYLVDLLTPFPVLRPGARRPVRVRMVGGLLGHWAFWTRRAVGHLERVRGVTRGHPGVPIPRGLLSLAAQMTDANGAVFDAPNRFRGCIPGIHEVLRRQGLLRGRWCLDPREDLSPGQQAEIGRVCRAYPHLTDDRFVEARLDGWLR